jgi:hypothetical protein
MRTSAEAVQLQRLVEPEAPQPDVPRPARGSARSPDALARAPGTSSPFRSAGARSPPPRTLGAIDLSSAIGAPAAPVTGAPCRSCGARPARTPRPPCPQRTEIGAAPWQDTGVPKRPEFEAALRLVEGDGCAPAGDQNPCLSSGPKVSGGPSNGPAGVPLRPGGAVYSNTSGRWPLGLTSSLERA